MPLNHRAVHSFATPAGSAAPTRKPTIEELERILASGEPLKIQLQPDGSIKAVRPVAAAIEECENMAAMLNILASKVRVDDLDSGRYRDLCLNIRSLKIAVGILRYYSEPPNEKGQR